MIPNSSNRGQNLLIVFKSNTDYLYEYFAFDIDIILLKFGQASFLFSIISISTYISIIYISIEMKINGGQNINIWWCQKLKNVVIYLKNMKKDKIFYFCI